MNYVNLGNSGLKVSRIALGMQRRGRSQPGVTAPIVGASKTWQIEQAAQAVDVGLSAEELAALAAPYRPHPVLGHQ